MFALIIGVHVYQNPSTIMQPLPGACADVKSMKAFLLSRNVQEGRIRVLRNKEATNARIIQELDSLASSEDIESNSPILIYFAGHGTRAFARGGSSKIEMICPYDFIPAANEGRTDTVYGILDITLAEHLDKISLAKGNNVVRDFTLIY